MIRLLVAVLGMLVSFVVFEHGITEVNPLMFLIGVGLTVLMVTIVFVEMRWVCRYIRGYFQ